MEVTAHETGPMAEALARLPGEMLLILTGSATSDVRDTGPEALRHAGGEVPGSECRSIPAISSFTDGSVRAR